MTSWDEPKRRRNIKAHGLDFEGAEAIRDNPPWSEQMLGPPIMRRGRGPQKAPTKVLTTIRLDADVIAFFRAQGSGYQSRINDALKRVKERGLSSGSAATASGRRVSRDVTRRKG